MNRNSVLFIVTGTVSPDKDAIRTKLLDAKTRLLQYIDSIEYLIKSGKVSGIIFCDNSNFEFPYSELYQLADNYEVKLEILTYKAPTILMAQYGKGAGELDIMDYVFSHSSLIHEYDSFFKITGRLKIKNIKKVITNSSVHNNYIQLYDKDCRGMPYADTTFYKMNNSDYLKLKLDKYAIDDINGMYLENLLYNRLQVGDIDFKYFRTYPIKTGISGSSLLKYDESWRTVLVKLILSKFNLMDKYEDICDYYISHFKPK